MLTMYTLLRFACCASLLWRFGISQGCLLAVIYFSVSGGVLGLSVSSPGYTILRRVSTRGKRQPENISPAIFLSLRLVMLSLGSRLRHLLGIYLTEGISILRITRGIIAFARPMLASCGSS